MPTTIKVENTRAILARWVREHIDQEAEVNLPELVNEAITHFSADKTFLTRFLRENIRALIYDLVQGMVASSRGVDRVLLGDTVTTSDKITKRARSASVFSNWLEHVDNHHVRLLDMTREELLIAATERIARGEAELHLANLWRTLAEDLEGGQRVRERFTAEEIEQVHASLKRKD